MDEYIILWGWVTLFMSGVVAAIGQSKGARGLPLFLFSILIWPLLLLFILFRRDDPKCPACLQFVAEGATRCNHCCSSLVQDEDSMPRPQQGTAARQDNEFKDYLG